MNHLPIELTLLGWSVLILLVHINLQSGLAIRDQGLGFNAGARDGEPPRPLGAVAARAKRALANFGETWPAFIALAVGLAVTGRTGGLGATGAWLWFGARLVYIPLYLLGVPYLRTLCFGVSLVGLIMMLVRFL